MRSALRYIDDVGIEIQLQDEFGNRIEGAVDPKNLLADLLPPAEKSTAYPMLAGIDPCGDTVFNGLQIRRFLSEWVDVVSKARTQEDRELASEIEKLARQCSDEVPLPQCASLSQRCPPPRRGRFVVVRL